MSTMPVDALSISPVFLPLFVDHPELLALAQAHDQVKILRRRLADVHALVEDYGHYLPALPRRRLTRTLTGIDDEVSTIRRTVLGPLDAALGVDE